MKLYLNNTAAGLVPLYDDDYEQKRKLRLGKVYLAEIKLARNVQFHRKYFALIRCAWEYQNGEMQAFFKDDVNLFRKTVEVAAGVCERVYNLSLKSWVDIPKSISFSSMSAEEFDEMYERIKDVLFSTFLRHISEEEFSKNLISF